MTIRITPDEYNTILLQGIKLIKDFNPDKFYFEFDVSIGVFEDGQIDGYDINLFYDGKMIGFFVDAEDGLTYWHTTNK